MNAFFTSPFAAGACIVLGAVLIILGVGIALDVSYRKAGGVHFETSGPRSNAYQQVEEFDTERARRSLGQRASAALLQDPRFAQVFVRQNSGGPLDGMLTLFGRVQTENDKWDARDALWHALGNYPSGPKAIFNAIVVVPERQQPARKDDIFP